MTGNDEKASLRAYKSIAAALPRYDHVMRERLSRNVCCHCGESGVSVKVSPLSRREPDHPTGKWHDVSCSNCGLDVCIRLPTKDTEPS